MVNSEFGIRSSELRPHSAFGFTLVELLVTTSLMALVGGATVAALGGGVRVWQRAAEMGTEHERALVAFEQMRRDLQLVRQFRPVPFDGSYNQYVFAAVSRAQNTKSKLAEIGSLGYFLNERDHRLCRSFIPYRLMKRERLTDHCETVLEDVTQVRFDYFGKDAASGEVDWRNSWESEMPPMAVKAEMVIQPARRQAASRSFVVYLERTPASDDENDKES